MDLEDIPGRAFRKWRKAGTRSVLAEARDLLISDFFIYRVLYRHYLESRIPVLHRNDLEEHPDSLVFDNIGRNVRLKGPQGFRGVKNPSQYDPGNRVITKFSDATVLGPVGPGITKKGEVIADTVATPPLATRRIGIGLAESLTANGVRITFRAFKGNSDPHRKFDTATLAVPPWNNYYHWTAECLTRIRLLERYGAKTGTYPTLLIPSDCPSWITESLKLIDYSGDITGLGSGTAKVDTLVVPTFPDPVREECIWLREQMYSAAECEPRSNNRIYIAREDATVRRVINQDAVQSLLEAYDINKYLLSELSVRKQIELFCNAELVIAPHGAGLTNIIYSDDVTVIELFGEKTVATFDRLAENMNHDYRYLQCKQDGLDIRVDVDELDETLRDALNT